MTSAERRVGPFEVRWGNERYKYSVIGDLFFTEWKSGMDSARSSYPLYGLSPDLTETVGRSQQTTKTLRISASLVVSSVIIFFSEYNKGIPLLAPFLLVVGGWWLVNAVRKVVPRAWTEIRKLNGDNGITLLQPEQRTGEWTNFENALSLAIREVNEAKT